MPESGTHPVAQSKSSTSFDFHLFDKVDWERTCATWKVNHLFSLQRAKARLGSSWLLSLTSNFPFLLQHLPHPVADPSVWAEHDGRFCIGSAAAATTAAADAIAQRIDASKGAKGSQ